MRNDAVVFVAAALAWAAFGYKLHHLRQRSTDAGGPVLRAVVSVLGLAAVLASISPNIVGSTLDPLLGVAGLTRLLANVVSMATCLAIIGWLLYLSRPEAEARARLRVHVRIFVAVLIPILILFAVDHPPSVVGMEFAGFYTYVFLLYVTYGISAQIALCWRYAMVVDAPLLRLGLRTVSASNVLGLVAAAIAFIYVLDHDLRLGLPGWANLFMPAYAVSSALFVFGLTLPAWGPRVGLEDLWWHVARRLAARRLRLLWESVTAAYPGLVLDRALLAASPHGQRLAAERMPIEIYDGWLQLRHYLTPGDIEIIDREAARTGRDDHSQIAAARLMLAIERKRHGHVPAQLTMPPVEHLGAGMSNSLIADVRFLCAVSRNLESRFVRHVLAKIPAASADLRQH